MEYVMLTKTLHPHFLGSDVTEEAFYQIVKRYNLRDKVTLDLKKVRIYWEPSQIIIGYVGYNSETFSYKVYVNKFQDELINEINEIIK